MLPLLIERDRRADVGKLYAKPLESLGKQHELKRELQEHLPQQPDAEALESLRSFAVKSFRETAA